MSVVDSLTNALGASNIGDPNGNATTANGYKAKTSWNESLFEGAVVLITGAGSGTKHNVCIFIFVC
jgi:hypothetical protein